MDFRAILMGLAFAVMWSSAFTSARVIVTDAPPLTALAVRFLIAGLLGVGLARALGQGWRLTAAQWRATAVFGVCQNGLYLGLNFVALQSVQASLAAIVASTMPLLVALFGRTLLGERLRPLGAVGLVAGIGGVAIVMGARLSAGVDVLGLALCVAGVVALTLATLSVRGAAAGGNVLMVVGLQMLIGAGVLAVPAVAFEEWAVDWSWRLVAAFAYAVFVPGLLATLVWFRLVRRIGATAAATFHFLNPFLGVAIAALLLGESFGPGDAVGVVVIMAGILAVQLSRQIAQGAEGRAARQVTDVNRLH